jgi:DNA-binding transcriptional LysR family regulator
VLKKQAHIGLLYGPIEATAATTIILVQTHIVCAVPASHKLAKKAAITPADLAKERIISAAIMPRWGQLVDEAFAAEGLSCNLVANCANSDLAFSMAATGAGIAVVPMVPTREGQPRQIVLRRFRPAISLPVVAVYNGAEPLSQLGSAVIDWLKASTRDFAWDAPE